MASPETKISIKPRPAFGLAFVANVGNETNIIRIDLPETMGTPDKKAMFAPVIGLPPVAFVADAKGVWYHETETPGLKVKGNLALEDAGCAMTLTVTNRLNEALHDLGAAVCLQLATAPTFRDLTREQVY